MKAMSMPGMTKTWSAKKRESVEPAMMGPPRRRLTIHGPRKGTRLEMEAPIPSPQKAS